MPMMQGWRPVPRPEMRGDEPVPHNAAAENHAAAKDEEVGLIFLQIECIVVYAIGRPIHHAVLPAGAPMPLSH